MPIPGHRQPPPQNRKNKKTVIFENSKTTAAVFPHHTFCPHEKTSPDKTTLPMRKANTEKHQSRSFDSHHIKNARSPCLLSFPMTGFHRRINVLWCTQRLVSSRILTVFPFHRARLDYKSFTAHTTLCVIILNFTIIFYHDIQQKAI